TRIIRPRKNPVFLFTTNPFIVVHEYLYSGSTNYCNRIVFRKENWRQIAPAIKYNKDNEGNHDDYRYNEEIFLVLIHF
ncbi:uncharacterized protein METZ01_LOCUS290108, partial [marine metagenome]